jgi:hypothetical protein
MSSVETACTLEGYSVSAAVVERFLESLREVEAAEAEELVEALTRAGQECTSR